MSKKLNKSETRNIALTRFVKETMRNQIYLKNGQSITFYDAIMNKLSPEDKTMVRKTIDLEKRESKQLEMDEKKRIIYYPFLMCLKIFCDFFANFV